MSTPNPNQVRIRQETGQQARRMASRLNQANVPTNARRAAVRANGYRGPLTRAELAKRVSNH